MSEAQQPPMPAPPAPIMFYQNNPCTIVRAISDQFVEICLSHRFAADMETTGQCEGCCIGDSDNKISCTCDDHSWIIEQVQDEENAIICMVETRLLLSKPIEGKAIKKLQDQIVTQQLELATTKELHAEWVASIKAMKQQKEALKSELDGLELSVNAARNIRNTAELGIKKLSEQHGKMVVEIQSYSIKNQTISKREHDELIKRDAVLSALEKGGVDNWEWYEDSLKNAGLMD